MNGRYLLDTNIVIVRFSGESSIVDRIGDADEYFVSSTILGELFYGAFNSTNVTDNIGRIESFLANSGLWESNIRENGMVTSIQLSEQELADHRELTNETDAAAAVRVAMQDYIRFARRMRLKQLSGKLEMQDNWQQFEQAELNGDSQSD